MVDIPFPTNIRDEVVQAASPNRPWLAIGDRVIVGGSRTSYYLSWWAVHAPAITYHGGRFTHQPLPIMVGGSRTAPTPMTI
ncbi:MAG: hypothetical protein SH847_06330 [Roseiflexaceae bacterium]|nr:hypothetical protein [Roseiflexaceae bacterium]